MQNPKVSLITPTYNQAGYLRETIDSVLAQSYQNLEYIIINDGSTDDTKDILDEFEGKITIVHQSNAGQAATLNKGWSMASGDIIGYLSSDDLLYPTAVETLVKSLTADPDAVLAYPDYDLIDSNSIKLASLHCRDFSRVNLEVNLDCTVGVGAIFYKSIFSRSGGWDRRLKNIPDFDFWLKTSNYGNFVHVKKSLAKSRIHEGSTTYKPMSFRRSTEVIFVLKNHWKRRKGSPKLKRKSLARAFLVAARNNIQSGRYLTALKFIIEALKLNKFAPLELGFWKTIAHGFRAPLFKLWGWI